MQVSYFCVLFGEKVDKCESSMCSRSRQLLRKPKCFDFSESAVKEITKRIELFLFIVCLWPYFQNCNARRFSKQVYSTPRRHSRNVCVKPALTPRPKSCYPDKDKRPNFITLIHFVRGVRRPPPPPKQNCRRSDYPLGVPPQ